MNIIIFFQRCTRCSKSFIYENFFREHIRRTHPDLFISTEKNENKENIKEPDIANIFFVSLFFVQIIVLLVEKKTFCIFLYIYRLVQIAMKVSRFMMIYWNM